MADTSVILDSSVQCDTGQCSSEEPMEITEQCESSAGVGSTKSESAASNKVSNPIRHVRNSMLDRVAKSDAHFKHQQRGEPDLTLDEKRSIAEDILDQNVGIFLSRFSKHLVEENLVYFDGMRTDYTVNFYVQEIQKGCDDLKNKKKIRNRRYKAMKGLVDGGEYFSDREMKSRDPLLYEQMVGQYLTAEEIQRQVEETGDGSISSVLMQHIEAIHNTELFSQQIEEEECQAEEDSEEEEEEDEDKELDAVEGDDQRAPVIPEEEKHLLRHEFIATMEQRFISGQDKDFDYKTVDENVEYDSLDIQSQDAEEKYFDDEEDPDCVCSEAEASMGVDTDCDALSGRFPGIPAKRLDLDQKNMKTSEKLNPS